MKNLSLLFGLLFILSSCNDERNCSDFKTGNFEYSFENISYKIHRTDVIQIEIDLESGIEFHSSIDWISDCDFVLTYERILNSPDDLVFLIGKKIDCSIIETEGKRMVVHAKSMVMDEKFEMFKVDL